MWSDLCLNAKGTYLPPAVPCEGVSQPKRQGLNQMPAAALVSLTGLESRDGALCFLSLPQVPAVGRTYQEADWQGSLSSVICSFSCPVAGQRAQRWLVRSEHEAPIR